jgi:putative ABC transport system permease protein
MRHPLRTAQTAAALMIGLALVSTIAVLGASLSTSAADQVDSAVNADYIVTGSGGFSQSVVPAVSRLPAVTTATTVYQGQFEVRGALTSLAAVTPMRLSHTVNLPLTAGAVHRRWPGAAADRHQSARGDHLSVGSPLTVRFAQTGATALRIGGIYEPNPPGGQLHRRRPLLPGALRNPLPTGVLLRTAPKPPLDRALNRALAPYANVSARTRAQFESDQKSKVNQEIGSSTSCSRWPSSSRHRHRQHADAVGVRAHA